MLKSVYKVISIFKRKVVFIIVFILIAVKSFPQVNKFHQTFHDQYGFIENKGQIKDQFQQQNNNVKYLLSSEGFNVQLRNNSFSYDTYEVLSKPLPIKKDDISKGKLPLNDSTIYKFHRVDIQLPGANPMPQIVAEEKLESYSVYYAAHSSEEIKAFRYKKISYKNIYPGIDLVFDSRNLNGGVGFEYYFIVKPGADANQIKLKYSGAETSLNNNKIVIRVAKGNIEDHIPASFLTSEKNPQLPRLKNKPVIEVKYKEQSKGVYKFKVPEYDRTKTLIIDPTPDLIWGTYYGGSLNDLAYCIARDPSGNILVGGVSDNPNLATAGAYQTVYAGFSDAMVGKFQSNGSLLWMSYYGADRAEAVFGICSDSNGNIYFTGIADSKTGIATAGSHQPVHGDAGDPGDGRDGFLVKFNAAGNRVWATYYGGDEVDYSHTVKADNAGNIFISGWTQSINGIATPGSFQPAYASGPGLNDQGDGFIARFDNNGTRIWGTYFGGQSFDRFYSMVFDNSSSIYLSGVTNSPGMATPGAHQPNRGGGINDALLVKFDKNGARIWATYYGGNNEDYSQAVTCDMQNNAIIGGMTISTNGIGTTGTYLPTFAGGIRDGFVAKFGPNGNRVWGTYYGGNGEETIQGLATDQSNNIVIAGSTYSQNNIATAAAYQPTFSGSGAIWTPFFAKIDPAGGRLWGTYYGNGSFFGNGDGEAAVTDNSGNVFVCGRTMAPTKIASCNAIQQTWAGNQDMFVAMFSETIISGTVAVNITANPTNTNCAGDLLSFIAVVANGGTNPFYQWKVNGVNAGTNNPTFTSGSLNNGDQISCTVTSNSPCATNPVGNSNVISVIINPSVIPAVSITSNINGAICIGTPVTFTATPINGGNSPSYQWKVNGVNAGTNSPIFLTSTIANGDMISCVLTNPFSCNPITSATSNTITVNVVSVIIPTITIASSVSSACSGSPVTFSATSLNAGNNPTYQWKVNGSTVGAGLTYSTTILSGSDIVECFLTPDGSACVSSGSIGSNKLTIQIHPLPDFSILPLNPTISKGDTLQLSITGASNVLSYKWTPPVNINNDIANNPRVWPASTQTYFLTTTSSQGCIKTGQVKVSVISEVWIPNAFSPNNDGLNDTWEIKGLELYSGCQVIVFNRYGHLIYQSLGYSRPWDGVYKGQKILPGTYVYLIDLRNGLNPLTGTVTIIR